MGSGRAREDMFWIPLGHRLVSVRIPLGVLTDPISLSFRSNNGSAIIKVKVIMDLIPTIDAIEEPDFDEFSNMNLRPLDTASDGANRCLRYEAVR